MEINEQKKIPYSILNTLATLNIGYDFFEKISVAKWTFQREDHRDAAVCNELTVEFSFSSFLTCTHTHTLTHNTYAEFPIVIPAKVLRKVIQKHQQQPHQEKKMLVQFF